MTTNDPLYTKRWRLDRAQGRTRTRDATAVRTHIQELQAARLSLRGIAEAAGVSPSVVSTIEKGQKTVSHRIAQAILAVTAEAVHERPNPAGFVPAVGTRRRLQALMCLGWRHQDVHAELGARGCTARPQVLLHQEGGWVSRANADAVRAVYDDLSTTQGPSAKTRAWAVKLRYAPPAAWDDGDMDDPYAIPAPGYEDRYDQCAAPGCVAKPYVKGLCERHYLAVRRGATLTAFNDVDMVFDVGEWAHLVRGGVGPAEAAVRCGGTIDMVEHRATEDQDVAVLRLLASAAHDAGDFNRGARLAGLASAAARATRDAKAA